MATGIVDWKEIDPPKQFSGDKRQVVYKRLTSGQSHRVRPVHKPMAVWKYYVSEGGKTKSVIVADPEVCPVLEKHPDLKPSLRYAINVIDREDGELKVLEGPPTVFRAFRKWYEKTSKPPGGEKGGDFGIDVEGKGLQTKYDCQFIEAAPFTEEEMNMIQKDPGLYKLPDIYKPHSPEEIERILFSDDSGDNSNRSDSNRTDTSSKPESSGNDDLFDEEKQGDSSDSGDSKDMDW